MSDSALLVRCSAFLTVFDRKKEFFHALIFMFTAVVVNLSRAEEQKELRLSLKLIMPLEDREWKVKSACCPCCLSELFMCMFLFGLPPSPLEKSED